MTRHHLTPADVPVRDGSGIRLVQPDPPLPPFPLPPVVAEFTRALAAGFRIPMPPAPPAPVQPHDVVRPDHIRYIEAPRNNTPVPGERAVALCGGIPGVEPWHGTAVQLFANYPHRLAILCPRRRDFPYNNPDLVRTQVLWEQRHIRPDNGVSLFWFPACLPQVTVQPTTLLELGWAIGAGQPFVVGAHPGYARRDILEHQLELTGRQVLGTLPDVVAATRALLEDVDPAL